MNTILCPIKVNSNTIELTLQASCYCVSDLLCVNSFIQIDQLYKHPILLNLSLEEIASLVCNVSIMLITIFFLLLFHVSLSVLCFIFYFSMNILVSLT